MSHENLKELTSWCKSVKVLRIIVRFYDDNEIWHVWVVPSWGSQSNALRVGRGADLEQVCAELLPKARQTYEQQKASLERKAGIVKKEARRQLAADIRELEAIHHSASDY